MINENDKKGLALLSAHQVGHVIAALALDMTIEYVRLGGKKSISRQIKLGFSFAQSDYQIQEKICFFSASQMAVDILLIEYSDLEKERYKCLLKSHFDHDKKQIEELICLSKLSDKRKQEIYMKAQTLVKNVFLSKGHLLHVFIENLMEYEVLTGNEIKRLAAGLPI